MIDVRYPIGKHEPQPFSLSLKEQWINDIKTLPEKLEAAVNNLNDEQLNTSYREGGWSLKQVVHHVADSHINGFVRFKLALTENNPVIKPYSQDAWNELTDVKQVPVSVSLELLRALHERWYVLLKNMKDEDFERTIVHPEQGKEMSLWMMLGVYAWHGKHHTAHITTFRNKNNW